MEMGSATRYMLRVQQVGSLTPLFLFFTLDNSGADC